VDSYFVKTIMQTRLNNQEWEHASK
jgi:hypothetical protein